MRPLSAYSHLALATLALGEPHYFFSGFFAGSTIVGIEFDDATSDLSLVNNITTQATSGSKWIAIDVGAFPRTTEFANDY